MLPQTLYQAMVKTKESEATLSNKFRVSNREIEILKAKVISAVAMAKDQIKEAENKKLEIETTFKQGDSVVKSIKETEERIEKTIEDLKNVTASNTD